MFKTRASAMLMDENQVPPILEGWIQKKSPKGNDRWQRRYLILRKDWIAWSKQKGNKPAGIIPLATIIFVAHLESEQDGTRFDFVVQGADARHTFYWNAENKTMAATWCAKLKEYTRAANAGLVTTDFQKVVDTTGKFWKNTVDISLRLRSTSSSEYTGVVERAASPAPTSIPTPSRAGLPPTSPTSPTHANPVSSPASPTATSAPQSSPGTPNGTVQNGSGRHSSSPSPTPTPGGSGAWPSASPNQSPRRMDIKPIVQGFLKKKSPKGVGWKVWQTRLFKLYEDALVYFKKRDGKPTGAIPLAVITEICPLSKKDGCRFDLVCVEDGNKTGRTIALLANSKKQRDQWIIAIDKAYAPIRGKSLLPRPASAGTKPTDPVTPAKLIPPQHPQPRSTSPQSFLDPVSIASQPASHIMDHVEMSVSHLSIYRGSNDENDATPYQISRTLANDFDLPSSQLPSQTPSKSGTPEMRTRPAPPLTAEEIAAAEAAAKLKREQEEIEIRRLEELRRAEEARREEERKIQAERKAKIDAEQRKQDMINDMHAVAIGRRALIVDEDSSDDESDFGDDDFGSG